MDLKTIFRVQIITLFDSICFGLIYAFINPYLIIVGGNHLIVGIFTVLNLICQLLAPDVMKKVTSNTGKQFSLFIVSVAATISYLLITLTNSCWFIIFARLFFTIANITNSLCKDILLQKIPKDETEYFIFIHNILSASGYIIGPIITGCLFSHGFSYSCWLAAVLTFGNVWLSTTLTVSDDDEDYKSEEQSLMDKKSEEIAQVVKIFHDSNFQENWDIISLKFLFVSSISIFFSKFTQILQKNFNSNAVILGVTGSYMTGLIFAGPYAVNNIKEMSGIKEYFLTIYSFIILLVSLIFACYSPFFPFYLLMCIPIALARCYLNSVWGSLFASRKNEALSKSNEYVGIVSGCTIPIVFGVICDLIGHHAVILFTIFPIIFSLLIFYQGTNWGNSLNDEKEDLKDKDE